MITNTIDTWPILVVDDEPVIVSVIQRQLGDLSLQFTSMTDSTQALEALESTHFALILSDNRMPELSGVELLKAAMVRSPHSRRILLTGYTDTDEAIQAFNDKVIHRYINKPWSEEDLRSAIRAELAIYVAQQKEHAGRQELELQARIRSQQLQAAMSAMRLVEAAYEEESRSEPTSRLAAVIVADVVGYSRLMGDNAETTLRNLNSCRTIWHEQISRHGGRLVNEPGDSLLSTFESASKAIQCAREVQHRLHELNSDQLATERMYYRIGISVGELIEQAGALYGEGINIAARIQALAAPEEVWVSQTAYENGETSMQNDAEFMGTQNLHNISKPVGVYRIRL